MDTIEGVLHLLGVGQNGNRVVFSSDVCTGDHPVTNVDGAGHFISKTLRLERSLKTGYMSHLAAGRGICVAKDKGDCNRYF